MPKVSIVLPVYNGAEYLGQAVESLLGQTFADFELLIIDDCSTDDSVVIAESYRDRRIRLIRSGSRLKLSGVLNLGLDNCAGELVARMDADDISLQDRLARQVAFMDANHSVDICGSWAEMFGTASGTLRPPESHEEIKALALFDNPFVHPSVIIRNAFVRLHSFRFDVSYYPAEDYELWTRMLECGCGANLQQVLLWYRIHAASLTRARADDMDREGMRIVRAMLGKLGITPDADDLKLHRHIATNRSYPDTSRESVKRAENWLRLILDSNSAMQVLNESALRCVVNRIWYGVCYRSLSLGFWVVQRFSSSPLSSGYACQKAILLGAFAKGKFRTSKMYSLQ